MLLKMKQATSQMLLVLLFLVNAVCTTDFSSNSDLLLLPMSSSDFADISTEFMTVTTMVVTITTSNSADDYNTIDIGGMDSESMVVITVTPTSSAISPTAQTSIEILSFSIDTFSLITSSSPSMSPSPSPSSSQISSFTTISSSSTTTSSFTTSSSTTITPTFTTTTSPPTTTTSPPTTTTSPPTTSSSSSTVASSSTSSPPRASSEGIPSAVIGIVVSGLIVLALLIVIILVLVIILFGVRKRKRSSKYVLRGRLTSENSENMILLREVSSFVPAELDDIFAHIPRINPIPLYDLERYVDRLTEGDDDSNAIDEFEALIPFIRNSPCNVSQTQSNSVKNRYINILPFDDTRVVLKAKADFVNANYIAGHNNRNEYIATQGPVPHTLNDFWQMVWQTGSDTIVMVTNPVEASITKCEVYWPENQQSIQYNTVGVTNINEVVKPSYTIRTFVLSVPEKKNKSSSQLISSRECKQFHFTAWPDMGVPMDVATMLRFVKLVRSNVKSTENPIIIHCSAGVGRTGTFIAIDVQMQRMKIKNDVNIKEMVLRLRAQRGNMVQTMPQYLFIYNCLLHEYLFGETEVNKSNIEDHFEKLLEVFPGTEDSRLEKEFQGANEIIVPDESLLEAATSNTGKNREGAGVPLDLNRVHLNDPLGSGDDYINASYLGIHGRKAEFVITQHPLESTRECFWRMMVERNFGTIVITGPVDDMDDVYWPVNELSLEFNELEVRLIEGEEEGSVKVYIIEVESEETEECITVKLFHLKDWPTDNDIPTSPKGIIQLSELVSDHCKGLIVIHTSASVKEQCTGVFCVMHSLAKHLEDNETVDIMGSTRRALQQRQGCLATKQQYQFVYESLLERLSGK